MVPQPAMCCFVKASLHAIRFFNICRVKQESRAVSISVHFSQYTGLPRVHHIGSIQNVHVPFTENEHEGQKRVLSSPRPLRLFALMLDSTLHCTRCGFRIFFREPFLDISQPFTTLGTLKQPYVALCNTNGLGSAYHFT